MKTCLMNLSDKEQKHFFLFVTTFETFGNKWNTNAHPSEQIKSEESERMLLVLDCSCWLRFHVYLQNWSLKPSNIAVATKFRIIKLITPEQNNRQQQHSAANVHVHCVPAAQWTALCS